MFLNIFCGGGGGGGVTSLILNISIYVYLFRHLSLYLNHLYISGSIRTSYQLSISVSSLSRHASICIYTCLSICVYIFLYFQNDMLKAL